jgi:hypothetical protein
VIAYFAYFAGKQLRLIAAGTARTFVIADIKHFIHAGMEGICLKSFRDLIHQSKHDPMYVRMQGAITLAVQAVGIGPFIGFGDPDMRRFIEIRVLPQQIPGGAGPGLMPQ